MTAPSADAELPRDVPMCNYSTHEDEYGIPWSTDCVVRDTADMSSMIPADSVAAFWSKFFDAESGISHHEACVGTVPYECDVVPMTRFGNDTSARFSGLSAFLTHEATACISVEAVNLVGIRSERVSTNCVKVDGTPPSVLEVKIGDMSLYAAGDHPRPPNHHPHYHFTPTPTLHPQPRPHPQPKP